MNGQVPSIEAPQRRSLFLRWRDRCLTALFWGFWWRPLQAFKRLLENRDGAMRNRFFTDLIQVSEVSVVGVILLVTWGTYRRIQSLRATRRETRRPAA